MTTLSTCSAMLSNVLLDPAYVGVLLSKSEIVSACLQAAETEHAGRIQAAAARQAGVMSLAAGLLAFMAGYLAYRAARFQYRFEKFGHLSREEAYREQLKAITIRASQELMILNERLTIIANLNSQLTISDLKVTSLDLCRNLLKPTEWPSHALLGTPALQQILPCYEAVQGAIQEIEDYVGNPTLSRIGNFLKIVRTAIEEASHLINAIEEGLKTLRRTKIDFE